MASDHVTAEGIRYETDSAIVRAVIGPDSGTAEHDLLSIVADLEGVEMDVLPSLYTQVDHLVERLYETPPSSDAQVEINFSYAGYRVTLNQQGHVTLVNVKHSAQDL